MEKNTDTVKLYQLENENLKELPIFNNIKERLVMPRFTDDGSLNSKRRGSRFFYVLAGCRMRAEGQFLRFPFSKIEAVKRPSAYFILRILDNDYSLLLCIR